MQGPKNRSITTMVMTRDEELHISRCVQSAATIGPVFVVDSGSTDATLRLAAEAGASVVEHQWEGYSKQKNWAIDTLPVATEWILLLDADETLDDRLAAELKAVVERDGPANGYYLARRNIFLGRELKHVWWYPDYQLRFFRRGKARYDGRGVHEHMIVDGDIAYIEDADIRHENIKGLEAHYARHLKYAELEVMEMSKTQQSVWCALRAMPRAMTDFRTRRSWIKAQVWNRMPLRPTVKWIWLMTVRRAWLDGKQGLLYAKLAVDYERMIDGFRREARLNQARRDVRDA